MSSTNKTDHLPQKTPTAVVDSNSTTATITSNNIVKMVVDTPKLPDVKNNIKSEYEYAQLYEYTDIKNDKDNNRVTDVKVSYYTNCFKWLNDKINDKYSKLNSLRSIMEELEGWDIREKTIVKNETGNAYRYGICITTIFLLQKKRI